MQNQYNLLQVAGYMGVQVWIARRESFGKVNLASSINLLNPTQDEMDNALSVAERDNYKNIICYELDDSEFLARQNYYVNRR